MVVSGILGNQLCVSEVCNQTIFHKFYWTPQTSWFWHYIPHPIAVKQSIFSTNNTIISTTTISQSTNSFDITSLHTSCPSFHYRHCYFLGVTCFLVTVNNRRTPRECMHSYFPFKTNKQLLQINKSQPLSRNWIVAFISCILGGNHSFPPIIQFSLE